MEKTITMLMTETRQKLADVVNNSGLPFCVLESIIQNLYNEIHMYSEQQLQQDNLVYQQKMLEAQENLDENKEDIGESDK